jgi:hypothetical protein
MDALHKHIGADDGAEAAVVNDRRVVADTFYSRGLAQGKIPREVFDKAKFAEGVDVGSFHDGDWFVFVILSAAKNLHKAGYFECSKKRRLLFH